MTLSPAAQRVADNYAGYTVAELNKIQQVHADDYRLHRRGGHTEMAAAALAAVNAFGEYIDTLDGTRQ